MAMSWNYDQSMAFTIVIIDSALTDVILSDRFASPLFAELIKNLYKRYFISYSNVRQDIINNMIWRR
jgi:hypothetical protein